VFKQRSRKPERIDTGDYTPEEYDRFLKDISFINRRLGDAAAIDNTLLREIERSGVERVSVLDVGAGSGEILCQIAEYGRASGTSTKLTGLDLNPRSARSIRDVSLRFPEISSVTGNALTLPFADDAFDFAISSLFTHHLSDVEIASVLSEMNRVARRGIFVVDLHRHAAAWLLFHLFCTVYRMSPMVRQDGALSVKKGFRPDELADLAEQAGLERISVTRHAPFRLVLSSRKTAAAETIPFAAAAAAVPEA
jgi:ubiquinone/menaquinone biosynthesis C-methylase UbiE